MPPSAATTALATDPYCKEHDTGPGHPESPLRLDAVLRGIADAGLIPLLKKIGPAPVEREHLLRVHGEKYLDAARKQIEAGEDHLGTGDTSVGPHSWEAAIRAAGCALAAVDAVMAGDVQRAFCAVRPPGHHATPDRGMGFCILNNIALAARHAQQKHGLSRVLIVDWDVHHGNGTQDVFYSDGSVFFFSTHQSPWYPGTGAASETGTGSGKGATMNCPLPAGSGRAEIEAAITGRLVPAMREFRPEFVLISAGFDSRAGDPLGQFTLADQDFADFTQELRKVADEHAEGRIVSILEGGYSLSGLASAAGAHVRALAV